MSQTTKPKAAAAKVAAKTQKLDLRELQAQQLNGEDIEQATGNQDSEYSFPAHESDRVHVKLITRSLIPGKKEFEEKDKVVKLVPQQFERMEANGSFAEYDKVTILHDPRSKAAAKAAQVPAAAGDTRKTPMQSVEGLPSLQDAQMRYQEVYGEKAPADKSYQELVDLIAAKSGLTEEEEEEQAAE